MYALLSGEDPCPYLRSMARGTGRGRLIPEQVWDADPIPEKGLLPGRPTGSAQPLLWAHAEYLKLYTAYHQRTGPVERLGRVMERYERGSSPQVRHWRREVPVLRLSPTERLLVECRKPFRLHLGWEGWKDPEDVEAEPLPFGLYGVLLDLEDHSEVNFTFFYPDENRWEGRDYQVRRG